MCWWPVEPWSSNVSGKVMRLAVCAHPCSPFSVRCSGCNSQHVSSRPQELPLWQGLPWLRSRGGCAPPGPAPGLAEDSCCHGRAGSAQPHAPAHGTREQAGLCLRSLGWLRGCANEAQRCCQPGLCEGTSHMSAPRMHQLFNGNKFL